MRIFIIIVFALLSTIQLISQPVSTEDVLSAAKNWMIMLSGDQNVTISDYDEYIYQEDVTLYIVNFSPTGFVLLSSDKNAEPILGYSHDNNAVSPLDSSLILWFNYYSKQIQHISTSKSYNPTVHQKWNSLINGTNLKTYITSAKSVGPLIQAEWDQDEGWNEMCPADPSGPGGHAWVGCVAVPMAQVMKYWEYPKYGSSNYSYEHDDYGLLSVHFQNERYTYGNMPLSYPNDEIQKLLYHCGVAIRMDYGASSSNANTSRNVGFALKTFFNFSSDIEYHTKESFSKSAWEDLIKYELDQGRPLIYRGWDSNRDVGHAFNVDGYDNSGYFHINWGWGGNLNGYFTFDELTPGQADYDYDQGAFFNIKPTDVEKPRNLDLNENNGNVELSWDSPKQPYWASYTTPMDAYYSYTWRGPIRATKYYISEFSGSNFVKLLGITHVFRESSDNPWPDDRYRFIVYDSDGSTILHQSPVLHATHHYEVLYTLSSPLTLSNNFYVAVQPLDPSGHPSSRMDNVNEYTGNSYYGQPNSWTQHNSSGYGREYSTHLLIEGSGTKSNKSSLNQFFPKIGYNVYRDGNLLVSTLYTNYTDENPLNGDITYSIKSYIGNTSNESSAISGSVSTSNVTPVVFIPGIMGSSLFNDTDGDNRLENNEHIWLNTSKLVADPWDSFLDVLRLKPDGESPWENDYQIKPAPLRNDPNRTLYDELFGNDATKPSEYYKMFFYELITEGYELDDSDDNFEEGESLFYFPYDWRKSNVSNASELNSFINTLTSKSGSNEVNLVVHSMGGLLTKQYIRIYGSSKINKLIFIGTPHLGAPKIYYTLLSGGLTLDAQDIVINNNELIKISMNMPSAYQLFPFQNYFSTNINNGSSSNSNLYSNPFLNQSGTTLSYNSINTYFKNVDLPNDWQFNSDMIDDKSNFQTYLSNINFGDIELYNIVGYGLSTLSQVRDQIFEFSNHSPFLKFDLTGDGTVPLRSAEIINNDVLEHTFYIPNVDHLSLTSDENVITIIKGLLSDPANTSFPDYDTPPSSYASDDYLSAQVACPVALSVYDSQGRHTGPTSGNEWETDIPGSHYIPGDLNDPYAGKIIVLPKGNNYTFEITSLNAEDDFNLYFNENVEGEQISFAAFENVQFDQYSKAQISFNTINDNILLELDINGDGNYENSISPTQITSTGEQMLQLPKEFYLSQNYPNPFNPSTIISYTIPKSSDVRITLHNSLGQIIKTLVNRYQQPGYYQIKFNAADLSSGVYFYRLVANDFVNTKKMILLK